MVIFGFSWKQTLRQDLEGKPIIWEVITLTGKWKKHGKEEAHHQASSNYGHLALHSAGHAVRVSTKIRQSSKTSFSNPSLPWMEVCSW